MYRLLRLVLMVLLAACLLPACVTKDPEPVTFNDDGMKMYQGSSVIVDGFQTEITEESINSAFNDVCAKALGDIFTGDVSSCKIATAIRYSTANGEMTCEHSSMAGDMLDKALSLDLKNVKSFGVAVFPIPMEDGPIAEAVCK